MAVSIVELPNGNLMAAWEHFVSGSVNDSYIEYAISTDGGETWGDKSTLVNTANKRDLEPQFYKEGNTVYLVYTYADWSGHPYSGKIMYRTTTDNGQSWSSDSEIASFSNLIRADGDPIKANSGRIIIPCTCYNSDTGYYESSSYYSDDNWSSWSQGGNAVVANETLGGLSMVELDNGDIMLIARPSTSGRFQWKAISSDEGANWGTPYRSQFPTPKSIAKVIRMSSGKIACVWNNVYSTAQTPRTPLTVAITLGTGLGKVIVGDIVDNADYRYSNHGVAEASSGDLLVAYTEVDVATTTETELLFCRIPAAEVNMSVVNLSPSKDTLLNEPAPDTNYGGDDFLLIRDRDSDNITRSILEFQHSLPSNAVIDSATLTLKYYNYAENDPDGKTVKAYKLSRTVWVEGEATWNIYKTGSNWTSSGGDYVTTSPNGGSGDLPASYGDLDITSLAAVVQDAVSNGNNIEILVRFDTEGLSLATASRAYFRSEEYETEADRPILTITYHIPAGSGGGVMQSMVNGGVV